ncbi:DNA-binding transcriptional regulator, MarR family [Paenibacillus sp. 1_12]|uniref:MarR family winged helix-turn-helix transcriptional regulator n=1 Tax=Paenibacillus sp. 1_12 TaxID=1566278 RepID=UPI0008EFB49A|nr:MarR family transcriptional regulator [Paenibacillus sp. 1_12]SFM25097.1 DNA-binding transcriptional regulator, MarR family [Paenibacillus sp. 1_12]
MEHTDIFKLIHAVELFTNEAIIRWMNAFEHNIGISPVLVLSDLKQRGPQKQTVLAKKLGYTPGAMTNIANRLIKLGMAERKYNENDRRNVFLSITEKGLDVLKEAQQKGQELRVELFQVLSEEELKQFLHIHEKLLKNFENPKAEEQ